MAKELELDLVDGDDRGNQLLDVFLCSTFFEFCKIFKISTFLDLLIIEFSGQLPSRLKAFNKSPKAVWPCTLAQT